MTSLDKAAVEDVLLSRIDVGWRRRVKPRVTTKLIRSIKEIGLVHPILLRPNGAEGRYELVTGQRRLEAFRTLGKMKIPARVVDLSDDDLREIELTENVDRLDFTSYEQSAKRLAEWKTLQQAEEKPEYSATQVSGKRGPAPKVDSTRALARAAGVSQSEVQQTIDHVDAGERYPMLKEPFWGRRPALEVANLLDELPTKVRNTTLDLVQKEVFDVDPRAVKTAVQVIKNMASFSPEKQEQVVALYRAKDPNEKTLAVTMAAKTPPMPDPREHFFDEVYGNLKQIVKLSKDDLREVIIKETDRCVTILKALEVKVCAAHQARVAEVVKD